MKTSFTKYTIRLAVFALSLVMTCPLWAQDWRMVKGRYFSMVLPERPIVNESIDAKLKYLRAEASATGYLGGNVSLAECPASRNLITKIFDRIVKANQLVAFIQTGPGMRLHVECYDDQLSVSLGMSSGPSANFLNVMRLNASLVTVLNSEDEIAFVVAHEMAHIVLGHTDAAAGLSWRIGIKINQPLTEEEENEFYNLTKIHEPEADRYGALFAMNAGYNPNAIQAALKNLEKHYSSANMVFNTVVDILRPYLQDGHGSNRQRRIQIERVMRAIGANLPYQPQSQISSDMLQARRELAGKNK